jgi:small subunit ribosomal protein S17
MFEEEKNDSPQDESPAEEESPQSSDPSPQDEGPAAEEAPEEAPAAEEEAPAAEEEAEAPAEEPAAEEAPAAEEEPAGEEAEAEAPLTPKQRRRLERSQHSETRPPRSPEERAAERAEARKRKSDHRRRWRATRREKRRAAGPREDTTPPPVERATGRPRERMGVVVSDRPDKTITVRIETQRAHRTYGKVVRNTSTLHAHDERNEANAGDTVRVIESRPKSRTKRWRLVEILERAK